VEKKKITRAMSATRESEREMKKSKRQTERRETDRRDNKGKEKRPRR
jgi:hypothetical protein